jgi:hypothetical protein
LRMQRDLRSGRDCVSGLSDPENQTLEAPFNSCDAHDSDLARYVTRRGNTSATVIYHRRTRRVNEAFDELAATIGRTGPEAVIGAVSGHTGSLGIAR